MNLTDWISQKTGLTLTETEQVLFLMIFAGGVLGLVFCHWWCQPPTRRKIRAYTADEEPQESQPSKKIQPIPPIGSDESFDKAIEQRDLRVQKATAQSIKEQYHCIPKGEEFMNSVAFYDKTGGMLGCVSINWDNQEVDIHVSAGCSATKMESGKLTVIRQPALPSSASSPESPSTFAGG